jgi:hypothetical protein
MILTQYATTTTNPADLTGSLLTVFSESNAGSTQEVIGTIRISNRGDTALTEITVQVNNPNRLGEQTVEVTGLSSFEIPLAPIVWRAGETLSVSVLSDNAGDDATTVVCDFHIRSLSATAPANWINNAALADNAIGASKVASDTITAAKIASNAITAAKIATDAITATKIASGAITSAKIATDAIGASQIAANAITSAKIAANAIGATQVADNTITAAKIASNAITSAKIAADAIGASQIANGALTAAKFASGAFDAVWGVTTRTLTEVANSIGVNTLLDRITGIIRTKAEADADQVVLLDAIDEKINVSIVPAVGISADRSPGITLNAFVGETIETAITLYQTDGTTPVVLTGKSLVIPFETRQGVDVATVGSNDITIGGPSDNVVTFNMPAAATTLERTLRFAIRDASAPKTVYLQGILSVRRAAQVDS